MAWNPYMQFRERELSLADHLAIDRTVLSNERTLLAYGRTALAMGIIGGSFLKFFDDGWVQLLSIPFLLGGGAVMVFGWTRYARTRRYLAAALEERTGSPTHPLETKVKEDKKSEGAATPSADGASKDGTPSLGGAPGSGGASGPGGA